ncbi:MAG: RNA methyltransferase [Bacteroidales bacterium]|nr:RNA methyltransferase [Bacteroidales bacterium]
MEKHRKLKIDEMGRLSVEQFKNERKTPIVVVLDNIRSLNNVGSIFRTCDAMLIEKIVLCGITACPPSIEIHKTALGAEDSVDWEYAEDTMAAIDKLRGEGYVVCSIEQAKGSVALQELKVDAGKRYAIVMGNEVKGVQQEVVDGSDMCIEIPQFGTKHSFNVSVTTGIVLWEMFRQMKFGK